MNEQAHKQEASLEECLALTERIAASPKIARASRLRAFLLYVTERSLRQGATNIPEQEIGEKVFDRQPEYDTSLDNIVRVNATELRKRLEHYFQEEGAGEDLVLTIPRGSYVPSFTRRSLPLDVFDQMPDPEPEPEVSPASETPDSKLASESPAALRSTSSRWLLGLVVFLGCAVVLLAILYVRQRQQYVAVVEPWRSDPALSRMWAPLLEGKEPLDLVTADTSLALEKDISGQDISLDDYIHFHFGNLGGAAGFSKDRQSDLEQVLDRNTVSLGDVHVAEQIFALSPDRRSTRILSAREFNSEAVRQHNVVLIGSQQSNPWVELFHNQLNFSLEYDMARHRAFLVNRNPKPGEQSRYEAQADSSHSSGYAVVALLPGMQPDKFVILLSGSDGQATQAAGEFITSPSSLRALFQKMPAGKVEPFEVLLRTTQLTGTPLRSEIVGLRVAGR